MLKYGMYAKAVELLCFKQALARLAQIYPDMDMKRYKRSVKREYKEMLLRTPDIGGSSLEMNLYIAKHLYFHCTRQSRIGSHLKLWMRWSLRCSIRLSW